MFVSHCAEDASWAGELARHLEKAGLSTFLRQRDVTHGQVVLLRVEDALETADAAVLVLGPGALADPAVQDEYAGLLSRAHRHDFPLVPVLWGPEQSPAPVAAASRLCADFRGLDAAGQVAKAVELAGLLRDRGGSSAAPGRPPLPREVADAVRPPTPGPGPAPPSFVVTYAADDAAYGRRLAGWLRDRDLPVWTIADLRFGDRFVREIQQRIRSALAMIVVMSPAAERSEDVEREILEGLRHSRELFPVLLSGDRNFLLASSWYFDARDGSLPGARELRLLSALRTGAGRPALPLPPPAAAPVVPGAPGTPLRRLRTLLAAGEPAHADVWTTSLLLSAAGRLDTGWLEPGDAARIPLSLLSLIDEQWRAAMPAQGFRMQLDRYRLAGERGTDWLALSGAYGWRPRDRRATPRYQRFLESCGGSTEAAPTGFFPTLRNPQIESHPSWYDRWQGTALEVHLRLREWNEPKGTP